MGQHKYNPTAIAAKKGLLPPKPQKPSKKEHEAFLHRLTEDALRKMCGVAPSDLMEKASYKAWTGMTRAEITYGEGMENDS